MFEEEIINLQFQHSLQATDAANYFISLFPHRRFKTFFQTGSARHLYFLLNVSIFFLQAAQFQKLIKTKQK